MRHAGIALAAVPVRMILGELAFLRDLRRLGLQFLQAHHVRSLALEPLSDLGGAGPDPVHIPGGDFHAVEYRRPSPQEKGGTRDARPSFRPRLFRRVMGRYDGVPDVLLDARTRRGGAGRREIHGGADAAPHPRHPADRHPHHAGIGVLAVPASFGWCRRRADADPDGFGVRVRRAGRAARVSAGHRGDATGDDAFHTAGAVAGVGPGRGAGDALGGDSAAPGAGGDDGVGGDDPAALRPRHDGGGTVPVTRTRTWRTRAPIIDRKSTRLNSSHGYISYA